MFGPGREGGTNQGEIQTLYTETQSPPGGFEWLNTSVWSRRQVARAGYIASTYITLSFFLFLAVKFGRMSKKQREKVEDEVRYHRAQMKAQQAETSPDSSVFLDNQQPSSSDQHAPYTSG